MAKSHKFDHTPFRVDPGSRVKLKKYATTPNGEFKNKKEAKEALAADVSALTAAQQILWADGRFSLLIIFQAMDAAGKDGTIRHVMSGVNPQGVNVYSFKAPTDEERLHHFLWRPMRASPGRGQIAIYNRSYYEEVLIVRVHPNFLEQQWIPHDLRKKDLKHLWESRYDDINAYERTITRNNVCVIKFFLNVSKQEQRARFLTRLEDPEKHWKFAAADLNERAHWDTYQQAYEDMLSATSTECAPWYVIPADKKWFTRACVADIIATRIGALDLKYPQPSEKEHAELLEARRRLAEEGE